MCLKTENSTPFGHCREYPATPTPGLHSLVGVYLPQQYGYPNERNFYHQFVNNRIGGKRIAQGKCQFHWTFPQAVIGQYAY